MRRFTKDDVETHREGYGYTRLPAVNVKSYVYIDPDKVVDVYHCSEATAEQAVQNAWECHAQSFWETDTDSELDYFFGAHHGLKVYSEGRSSGWLVVKGLPEIESWDAIAVARWGRFARAIRLQVDYLCSIEAMLETIGVNGWALDADAFTYEVNACLDLVA